MNDLEALVTRTIATITRIADRVTRFATLLLVVVAVIATGSFLLGLAALRDGIRSVWMVLGLGFGAIAVGAALTARWRLGSVRKDVPALAGEVRALISEGRAGTLQVIETLQDDTGSGVGSTIVLSRRVVGLRGALRHGLSGTAKLSNAVNAIATFPGLALVSILVTIVFAFLALIFLVALAL